MKLQDYNFLLQYIPGKTSVKADILSRKNQVDTKDNKKDVQILKEELWAKQQIIADIKVIWKKQVVEKTTLLEEIWQNGISEHEVVKELDKQDGQAWEDNGIVYVNGRIYILNNKKIREQILQENHDLVDIGYSGQQRIIKLIKRNYWWPGIKEDIKKYVQRYMKCQQNKVQH